MLRLSITLSLLISSSATVAQERRFAIHCRGMSTMADTVTGSLLTSTNDLPKQIYVLDSARNLVEHALEPRQEFESVCDAEKGSRSVSFSKGLISVHSTGTMESGTETVCDFSINRLSGNAELVSRMNFSGGRFHEYRWIMKCEPGVIPSFNSPQKF
jgi:hypothetical protein